MFPMVKGGSWGASLGEGGEVPRAVRGGRSVPRSKGGGMVVPGAEGRGAVVPGAGGEVDRGPQGSEQLGFPGLIKVSEDVGAGPRCEAPPPPCPSLYSTTWTIAPCTRTTAYVPETLNAVGVREPAKLPHLLGLPRGP